MNVVSSCCHRSIIRGSRIEHPLNDRFYISYSFDMCECCGGESPDTVEECEVCGVVGCAGDCE